VKLRIVALGHRMPAWVSAGYAEYAKRLPHDVALQLVELKPEPRDRGRTLARLLAAEADRIRGACAGCTIIALDERGAAWTTRAFAGELQMRTARGESIAFVIGSADGLDAAVKREAAAVFALSALTLPHGMVRVLLAEQIYRAVSLLSGHPYHRE
jgi:23S rRNA (pseudouridine1915-N3)-methyltransferase